MAELSKIIKEWIKTKQFNNKVHVSATKDIILINPFNAIIKIKDDEIVYYISSKADYIIKASDPEFFTKLEKILVTYL